MVSSRPWQARARRLRRGQAIQGVLETIEVNRMEVWFENALGVELWDMVLEWFHLEDLMEEILYAAIELRFQGRSLRGP